MAIFAFNSKKQSTEDLKYVIDSQQKIIDSQKKTLDGIQRENSRLIKIIASLLEESNHDIPQ